MDLVVKQKVIFPIYLFSRTKVKIFILLFSYLLLVFGDLTGVSKFYWNDYYPSVPMCSQGGFTENASFKYLSQHTRFGSFLIVERHKLEQDCANLKTN